MYAVMGWKAIMFYSLRNGKTLSYMHLFMFPQLADFYLKAL